MTLSDLWRSQYSSTLYNSIAVLYRAIFGRPIGSRIRSIKWLHFQWPLNTDCYKGMSLFDIDYIKNGTWQIHRYNGIGVLIGTCTRPWSLTGQVSWQPYWLIPEFQSINSMYKLISRKSCITWLDLIWLGGLAV